MSSNGTGVTARILTADWVEMQLVACAGLLIARVYALSVLVPGEGGVVPQNA